MNFQFINCNLLIEAIFLPLFAENFLTFAVSHLTFSLKVELVFGLHSFTNTLPDQLFWIFSETIFEIMWQMCLKCSTSKVSHMTEVTET